jgi:succinyl-diaminopimelate desuccinylase
VALAPDVLSAIDHARARELLASLVRIPTPSGKEQVAAEMLEAYLREAGFRDVRRDDRGNVLVTVKGTEPGSRRAFFTHTDSGGVGQMKDPYEPRVLPGAPFGKSGQVLRGLGASAPKSAVAAMVEGLRAVVASSAKIAGTIYLAIVTKDLLADHAGPKEILASFPFEADWMIAGEPSGNKLVLGARGIGHYRVTFAGKTTHNGRPRDGVNPLYGVADLLAAVEKLELPSHAALGPATISPFEVGSDAAPPQTPAHAHVILDRRMLPGEKTADVQQIIESMVQSIVAKRPGLTMELQRIRAMHPFDTPKDSALVRKLQDAVRSQTGAELETTYIAFSSNAGYAITEKGWQGVGLGPGYITDLGADEHVELEQVEAATKIFAALMARG